MVRAWGERVEAAQAKVSVDDVHVVGYADFNAPGARQSSKADSLALGVSLCNSMGDGKKNCCLIFTPDLPKESSLRGLWDEEKMIMEALFGLKQLPDWPFIDLYTRDARGEAKSTMRRWGAGRIVVSNEAKTDNVWLDSELAICGRPVGRSESEGGAPCSLLPRSNALLLPEGASAESDIKLADRTRPSPEQTAAQKGQGRLQMILESLFRHTSVRGPVLIVNLTGYVEELAAAVPCMWKECF